MPQLGPKDKKKVKHDSEVDKAREERQLTEKEIENSVKDGYNHELLDVLT